MPVYEYRCHKCGKTFDRIETMTMSEHGTRRVTCPKCKSVSVKQVFGTFSAITSKKS